MKKLVLAVMVCFCFGYSCSELIQKFHAPNPQTKTMKQLKRWVNNHISKKNPLKEDLLQCLIDNAADNPNQETIAGE